MRGIGLLPAIEFAFLPIAEDGVEREATGAEINERVKNSRYIVHKC